MSFDWKIASPQVEVVFSRELVVIFFIEIFEVLCDYF